MRNTSQNLAVINALLKQITIKSDVLNNATSARALQAQIAPLESSANPDQPGLEQIFLQAAFDLAAESKTMDAAPTTADGYARLQTTLHDLWASYTSLNYLERLSGAIGFPGPVQQIQQQIIPQTMTKPYVPVTVPGLVSAAPPSPPVNPIPTPTGPIPSPPGVIVSVPPISPPAPPPAVTPSGSNLYLAAEITGTPGSGQPNNGNTLKALLGVNTVYIPVYAQTTSGTSVDAFWDGASNDPTIVGGTVDLWIDAYNAAGLNVILALVLDCKDGTARTAFRPLDTITFFANLQDLAVALAATAARKSAAAISITPELFPYSGIGDTPAQYMPQWTALYNTCKSYFSGPVLYQATALTAGPIGGTNAMDFRTCWDAIGVNITAPFGSQSQAPGIRNYWETSIDPEGSAGYNLPLFGGQSWVRKLYTDLAATGKKIWLYTGISATKLINPSPVPSQPLPAPPVPPSALPTVPPAFQGPISGATAGTWQSDTLNGMTYYYLLPHNYNAQYSYPMVLYLHRTNNAAQIPGGDTPVKYLNTSSFRANYPCILVAPILNQGTDTTGATVNWGGITSAAQPGQDAAIQIARAVIAKYSVNPNKVYVTGEAMGGEGAWDMIIKYNALTGTQGRIFAAALPFGGAISYLDTVPTSASFRPDQAVMQNLRNVPIWAIHGAGDTTITPYWDQGMASAQSAIGGIYKFTSVAGAAQDVWDDGIVSNWHGYNNTALYDWMFAQASVLAQVSPPPTVAPSVAPVSSPTPVATYRKVTDQPYASSSVWNYGIGANAQFGASSNLDVAQLRSLSGILYAATSGQPVYNGASTDPAVVIHCSDSTYNLADQRVHIPRSAVFSTGGGANMTLTDVTQQGYRWSYGGVTYNNGVDVTGGLSATTGALYSVCGDGITDTTGRINQYDYAIGAITDYDIAQGVIRHALRFTVSNDAVLAPAAWNQVAWPASHASTNTSIYTGNIAYGATVAIPISVDITALGLTQGGLMLARALQLYGAIMRDTAGSNLFAVYATPSLESNALIGQMRSDLAKIIPKLNIIRNQSATTVNGGGASIAPAQLPLDPSVCS